MASGTVSEVYQHKSELDEVPAAAEERTVSIVLCRSGCSANFIMVLVAVSGMETPEMTLTVTKATLSIDSGTGCSSSWCS